MRAAPAFAIAALLAAPAARADILPPNAKGAKLSIRVDAQVPAGKLLIIANTFRGADVVTPNSVVPLEWHPLGGAMQIMMVVANEAKGIEEARKSFNRDAIADLKKRAVACGPEFQGVRTLPDTSPAEEVRWNWSVTFSGDKCTATLASEQFLDKSGSVVDPDGGASPPIASAAPAPDPTQAPAPSPPHAAPPQPSGCGSCSVGASQRGAPALLLVGLPLLVRRRRSRA